MLARKANCVYEIRPKKPFGGDTEVGRFHICKEIPLVIVLDNASWKVVIYIERAIVHCFFKKSGGETHKTVK